MPNYYAAGISASLTATSLSSSTTTNFVSRPGHHASSTVKNARSALSAGRVLKEQPLDCVDYGSGLHFLGKWGQVPFLCVGVEVSSQAKMDEEGGITSIEAVRDNLKQEIGPGESKDKVGDVDSGLISLNSLGSMPQLSPDAVTVKHNKARGKKAKQGTGSGIVGKSSTKSKPAAHFMKEGETSMIAQLGVSKDSSDRTTDDQYEAVSLSIKLSEKTFSRTKTGPTYQDIKIEVLLNGELALSTFVPSRSRSEAAILDLQISGKRIGRIMEKAWIVKVPQTNTGSLTTSESEMETRSNAEKRWQDVAAALQAIAATAGAMENGKQPPTAEYLESLANMPIPRALLSGHISPQYALLDVVISLGDGKKFPTNSGYLTAPARLEDDRYSCPVPSSFRTISVIRTGGEGLDGRPAVVSDSVLTSPFQHPGNKRSYPGPIKVIPPLLGLTRSSVPSLQPSYANLQQERRPHSAPIALQSMMGTGPEPHRRTASLGVASSISVTQTQLGSATLLRAQTIDTEIVESPVSSKDMTPLMGMSTPKESIIPGTGENLPPTKSGSWSFRSRDGAKTPVLSSSPHAVPEDSLVAQNLTRVTSNPTVVTPYIGNPIASTPIRQSPSSAKLIDTAFPVLPVLPKELRTPSVLTPQHPQSSANTIHLQGIISARARSLDKAVLLRDYFPSRQSLSTAGLFPLKRVARRPFAPSDVRALGPPLITMAEGETAHTTGQQQWALPSVAIRGASGLLRGKRVGSTGAKGKGIGIETFDEVTPAFEAAVDSSALPKLSLPPAWRGSSSAGTPKSAISPLKLILRKEALGLRGGYASTEIQVQSVFKEPELDITALTVEPAAKKKSTWGGNRKKSTERPTKQKRSASIANFEEHIPNAKIQCRQSGITSPPPLTLVANSNSAVTPTLTPSTMRLPARRAGLSVSASIPMGDSVGQTSAASTVRQTFTVPELSRGCILSYMSDEEGGIGGGMEGVRQVKAERGGVFRETEVLLGVRFLVFIGGGDVIGDAYVGVVGDRTGSVTGGEISST